MDSVGSIDEVQLQFFEHLLDDRHLKVQKLLMTKPRLALRDPRTACHIQVTNQSGGAVADVVVRDAHHVAKAHAQQRLRSDQCFDLRLLVNSVQNGVLGGSGTGRECLCAFR